MTDTRTILCSLSETLQTSALSSSLLYLVPDTSHQHATRGYNGYLLAYFFCVRHTLRMRIPSSMFNVLVNECSRISSMSC